MTRKRTDDRKSGRKAIICVLLLIFAAGCGAYAWRMFTGPRAAPEFPLPEAEINAVEIPKSGLPNDEIPENGGGGSVIYSDSFVYDKSNDTLYLNFRNPDNSRSAMVINLVIDGNTVYRSGLIMPGYGLLRAPEAGVDLARGEYECMLRVEHYDPSSGEKSMFNLETEGTLEVRGGEDAVVTIDTGDYS